MILKTDRKNWFGFQIIGKDTQIAVFYKIIDCVYTKFVSSNDSEQLAYHWVCDNGQNNLVEHSFTFLLFVSSTCKSSFSKKDFEAFFRFVL